MVYALVLESLHDEEDIDEFENALWRSREEWAALERTRRQREFDLIAEIGDIG